MRAREEAVVPAIAGIELRQQHEQLVGGRMQTRRQHGDVLAERV